MCGITGIYAFNEAGRFHLINLAAATEAMALRGPDFQRLFLHEHVGLGHRRLSIIDTSAHGHQPMTDPSGRYTLAFNGEIYNYKALREGLQAQGIEFQSHSDTEVLLHLLIHQGEAALPQLNGFFAFAFYDKEADTLLLARDRMGIKPLYIYQDEDKLLFGSEMKAILAYGVQKALDPHTLFHYLQLNYVPHEASMFKHVRRLLPGHCLRIKGRQLSQKAYYTIPYTPGQTDAGGLDYEGQQARLRELLEQAVQRRLVADVPLGSFLSGGIDSSTIVALATRHVEKLNTFSIGYADEPYFDETNYAQLVAKKFNTNHTVFKLTNQDLYAHLHQVLDYFCEPFADSSALPVYILSKETRKIATVALSGDGADEVFSGYNKHMAMLRVMQGGSAANVVKALLPLWQRLPQSRSNPLANRVRQLKKFAEGMALSPQERYWRWASLASAEEAGRLLANPILDAIAWEEADTRQQAILQPLGQGQSINDYLMADMNLVLPDDMLTKVDRMSMANSLEVRVPFLDHELVNFAFGLPASSKINRDMKKRIVQDAFREILPAELYKRPKHGFEVPLLKWFRTELKGLILDDLLSDKFLEEQGIFSVEGMAPLKHQLFSKNPGDVHARIWALIVFQWWWKRWMA